MNFMKLSLYPIDGIAEHLNLSMEHDAFNRYKFWIFRDGTRKGYKLPIDINKKDLYCNTGISFSMIIQRREL